MKAIRKEFEAWRSSENHATIMGAAEFIESIADRLISVTDSIHNGSIYIVVWYWDKKG